MVEHDLHDTVVKHRLDGLRSSQFLHQLKFAAAEGHLAESLSRCGLATMELRLGRRAILFLGPSSGSPLFATPRWQADPPVGSPLPSKSMSTWVKAPARFIRDGMRRLALRMSQLSYG